jgi:hypothetical protein
MGLGETWACAGPPSPYDPARSSTTVLIFRSLRINKNGAVVRRSCRGCGNPPAFRVMRFSLSFPFALSASFYEDCYNTSVNSVNLQSAPLFVLC